MYGFWFNSIRFWFISQTIIVEVLLLLVQQRVFIYIVLNVFKGGRVLINKIIECLSNRHVGLRWSFLLLSSLSFFSSFLSFSQVLFIQPLNTLNFLSNFLQIPQFVLHQQLILGNKSISHYMVNYYCSKINFISFTWIISLVFAIDL